MTSDRYAGLTIDTFEQFKEQVELVRKDIGENRIAGFDCMLTRDFQKWGVARREWLRELLARGWRISLQVSEEGTETHLPTRVYVTPPVKMERL